MRTGRHPAADRTPELVDEIMARFEPPPATCVVLDARLQPELLKEAARQAVRARTGLAGRVFDL